MRMVEGGCFKGETRATEARVQQEVDNGGVILSKMARAFLAGSLSDL